MSHIRKTAEAKHMSKTGHNLVSLQCNATYGVGHGQPQRPPVADAMTIRSATVWQRVLRQNWIRLSERVTLRAGDKVRVSGGPYWEQADADGTITRMRMGERGVMAFEEYCELGQSRWIVARGRDGYAALHVGPEERSTTIPGLVRRPYRLRKVRAARRRPARALPAAAPVITAAEPSRPVRRRGAA